MQLSYHISEKFSFYSHLKLISRKVDLNLEKLLLFLAIAIHHISDMNELIQEMFSI